MLPKFRVVCIDKKVSLLERCQCDLKAVCLIACRSVLEKRLIILKNSILRHSLYLWLVFLCFLQPYRYRVTSISDKPFTGKEYEIWILHSAKEVNTVNASYLYNFLTLQRPSMKVPPQASKMKTNLKKDSWSSSSGRSRSGLWAKLPHLIVFLTCVILLGVTIQM